MPAAVDIPFEMVQYPSSGSFDKFVIRDREFTELLPIFKDHPRVTEVLENVRNPKAAEDEVSDDPVGDYVKLLKKYRLLTPLEVTELFQRMERGLYVKQRLNGHTPTHEEEAALADLVASYQAVYNCNLRLAFSGAVKRVPIGSSLFLDMVQEANIGLGTSIRRFDYSMGFKFSTYSFNWIKQAVQRGVDNQSRTIRLPVHKGELWKKVQTKTRDLELELGRTPSLSEIAAYTDISADEIQELQIAAAYYIPSLNAKIGDDKEAEFGDLLADPNNELEKADDRLAQEGTIRTIFNSPTISAQQKLVLSLRYGVYTEELAGMSIPSRRGGHTLYDKIIDEAVLRGEGMTLDAIGQVLGVVRERVRHIEESALANVRSSGIPIPVL